MDCLRMVATACFVGLIATPGASFAHIVTVTVGNQVKEIRCNDDASVTLRPLLHFTRQQCARIGEAISVLPFHAGKRERLSAFDASPARIGDVVPRGIAVQQLPRRLTESFPQLKRYRYFLVAQNIAITDAKSRMIVAIVDVNLRSPRTK
jgi:hypothetical protein